MKFEDRCETPKMLKLYNDIKEWLKQNLEDEVTVDIDLDPFRRAKNMQKNCNPAIASDCRDNCMECDKEILADK
jgi:hypothetical protein